MVLKSSRGPKITLLRRITHKEQSLFHTPLHKNVPRQVLKEMKLQKLPLKKIKCKEIKNCYDKKVFPEKPKLQNEYQL